MSWHVLQAGLGLLLAVVGVSLAIGIGAGDRFAPFVMPSTLRFARRGFALGQAGLAHAGD
jgi:hypothetical protein